MWFNRGGLPSLGAHARRPHPLLVITGKDAVGARDMVRSVELAGDPHAFHHFFERGRQGSRPPIVSPKLLTIRPWPVLNLSHERGVQKLASSIYGHVADIESALPRTDPCLELEIVKVAIRIDVKGNGIPGPWTGPQRHRVRLSRLQG